MCRHECLRLGRNGREDAFLLEALAVQTATLWILIETRATNLASSTISARNGCSLSWCRLTEIHVLLLTTSAIIWLISSIVSIRRRWRGWRSVRILLVCPWVGRISIGRLGVLRFILGEGGEGDAAARLSPLVICRRAFIFFARRRRILGSWLLAGRWITTILVLV